MDILQLPYTVTGLDEIEIKEIISAAKYQKLEARLAKYGIEIIDDPKSVLVQKI